LPARDGGDAEPRRGRGAGRRGPEARARRAAGRARSAGGDRDRRARRARGPPVRRRAARGDPGRAGRERRDPRRRLHALRHARGAARARAVARGRCARRGRGGLPRGGAGLGGHRQGRGAGGCARPAWSRMSAGSDLAAIRERKPLVHQITNYVVMNETANATLALGALPVMAHAREEVEEMAALAGALVLNIGTLSPPWVDAMLAAGRAANAAGVPVVLDPVGAGATSYRTETARQLLHELDIAVVRGNAAEIATLAGREAEIRGVESIGASDTAAELAREAARDLGVVAAVTGAADHVSDGETNLGVANGDPLLARITGSGCIATAITGSFLAVRPDAPLVAAAEALVALGVAGEDAARDAKGPGSFHAALYDALDGLDPQTLDGRARL